LFDFYIIQVPLGSPRTKDCRGNFDIYLPLWLAKCNESILELLNFAGATIDGFGESFMELGEYPCFQAWRESYYKGFPDLYDDG
jgi:hypothetical protein